MSVIEQINLYKGKVHRTFPIKSQIRLGGLRFLSFVIVDIVCLIISNLLTSFLYLRRRGIGYLEYSDILVATIAIDVIVTLVFNTLNHVLRRGIAREVYECVRHIFICTVILCLCLFGTKSGANYSRAVVFLTYIFDFVLILFARQIWKKVVRERIRNGQRRTALVMTSKSFAQESIAALKNRDIEVRYIYLLRSLDENEIQGIPVVKNIDEAVTAICWEQIDHVFIYGLDDQAVPSDFIDTCHEMGVNVELMDFTYRLIDINTVTAPNPRLGNLAFLEARRDIPFPIRRAYWITETEAHLHRGYHAHKLNCQLLFCPHGVIDIILDDGKKKDTVRLDEPGKGLILMPGLWREVIWQASGSVLCVLASEYYDPDEYIRDYDEFIKYTNRYNKGA